MDIFRQILDLDEDDSHDFSLSMVEEYFEQAQATFKKLDRNVCVVVINYSLLNLTFSTPYSCV